MLNATVTSWHKLQIKLKVYKDEVLKGNPKIIFRNDAFAKLACFNSGYIVSQSTK